MSVSISPLGDSAITVSFGNSIDENINLQVVSLHKYLKLKKVEGFLDIIPAYASLTVLYDVYVIRSNGVTSAYNFIKNIVEQVLSQIEGSSKPASRMLYIPVCYDRSLGIDLEEMSEQKQLDIDKIIQLHTSQTYRVYMIGFLPGFAYMGKVDEKIAMPRKATPRQKIAAGSVGIADNQTGIYPFDSPGGWNLIGRTPKPLFYPMLNAPCLFQPGDEVQFKAITLDEYLALVTP